MHEVCFIFFPHSSGLIWSLDFIRSELIQWWLKAINIYSCCGSTICDLRYCFGLHIQARPAHTWHWLWIVNMIQSLLSSTPVSLPKLHVLIDLNVGCVGSDKSYALGGVFSCWLEIWLMNSLYGHYRLTDMHVSFIVTSACSYAQVLTSPRE